MIENWNFHRFSSLILFASNIYYYILYCLLMHILAKCHLSLTGDWLKNAVCPWTRIVVLTDCSLKVSIHMKKPWILTITVHMHSLCLLLEASGAAVISFAGAQLLSSNATTDVLMLMLSLILSRSCFFIPLSSETETNPSRTILTTGGLCANMIRANRHHQTTNKDRARQKETFRKRRKTKAWKMSSMKRRIKGLREKRTNIATDKRASSSSRSDGWMSRVVWMSGKRSGCGMARERVADFRAGCGAGPGSRIQAVS